MQPKVSDMRRTIFVSSTYQDLGTYRKAIWELLGEYDVAIRGMEEFGARSATPLETCLIEVEQSDIYIGVIGFRLGSVQESTGKSYTQLEYERALELKKETLIYLIDEENARVPIKFIDRGTNRDKLEAFKATLRDRHTVDTFVMEEDLVQKLRRDLSRYLKHSRLITVAEDEYAVGANTIRKFLLVPKVVAGREVLLDVKLTGNPYPASREICSAFNYVFGATIGVSVEIVRPDGLAQSGLDELYLGEKQVEEFLPVTKGEVRTIYAKLQFTESAVEKVRTRFRHETTYKGGTAAYSAMAAAMYSLGEPIHNAAEAKIILALTKPLVGSRESDPIA